MTYGRTSTLLVLVFVAAVALPATIHAQGVQTGVLSGIVKDPDGLPVPGATVTVTSPALQGERFVVTDQIGAYIIRGLPPGTYTVRVDLGGTAEVEDTVVVPLGGTARLDLTLQLAGVQELVTVVAELTPPALAVTQRSTNLTAEMIQALPIGRTPFLVSELAPGLNSGDAAPNIGQVRIGGAFAYDSIYLIDGVDTNDNLFGSSNNLFVEDAILETQVVTGGASAEYGRFGGGLVNVITRSGGNDFSGSFRTNLSRPNWSKRTPFERNAGQTRSDVLSKNFEITVGGPVLRDRLWFFNADRFENSVTARTINKLGATYDNGTDNKRVEIKLTGRAGLAQTFSGTYLNNSTTQTNQPSINADLPIDLNVILPERQLPNNLWVANWNGALTERVFGTFQWSRKEFGFRNAGSSFTDIVDSPFLARGLLSGTTNFDQYNAPYFSANDPENRNNRQFAGSVSYFASSPRYGRHDFKGGVEHFTSNRDGGNSQSSTGYVFRTDYLVGGDGLPVRDAAGRPIPVWGGNAAAPGSANTRIEQWLAVPGATLNIRTLSLYVQDRWTAANRVTVDLGLRYENVRSNATGDIAGADTTNWMPRLGLSFDVEGTGRTIAQLTYGRYSGRFTERAFGRNTNVGTPSRVDLAYVGPNGQGRDFAPAFDLNNNYVTVGGNFPTANVFFADGLNTPNTDEVTVSLGHQLTRTGYVRGVYSWRRARGFIDEFIDDPTAAGKITVVRDGFSFGTFDRVEWRNADDLLRRDYQALMFESRVQVLDRFPVEGNWTIELKNHGNFEGEAGNQPGNGSVYGDRPEFFNEARYYPYGRLSGFQRHKVRLWTTYNQRLGPAGSIDISPIVRINSGLTYSLSATGVPLSPTQLALNPGYARPTESTYTLFFGERGSESFEGFGLLDLSLRYGIPVWRTAQPWLQVQIYNVLDNQKLIMWNTTVQRDMNSPLDELGQPTGYIRGANFGNATSAAHYPRWVSGETGGRTFRLAMGFRF
jgi:hypothetical protein